MRINSINNNLNFKRAIPVSNPNFYEAVGKRELDNTTVELSKVLNSKNSSYSHESTLRIRNFFKSVLGDYNGHNGVEFRKLPEEGTLVLLSGSDLKAVKRMEEEQRPIKKSINKSKTKSIRKKKQAIQDLHLKVDAEILRRLEDGVKGKPKTYLNLNPDYSSNKLKSIKYCSKQIFYTALVDGFVDKSKPQTYHPNSVNKAQNFIYEEKSIYC